MLRDFEHKAIAVVDRLKRVENGRQVAVELHVDDGADHLGDAAGGIRDISPFLTSSFFDLSSRREVDGSRQSASAPDMISINSLVIIAWRVRL